MIPYLYYFEICERPEIPNWLRSDIFYGVAWVQGFVGLRKMLEQQVAPEIILLSQKIKDDATHLTVIEMGAGDGGSLVTLSPKIENRAILMATDKFPQPEFWKSKFSAYKNISWKNSEISFENFDVELKSELSGSSLLFFNCAFHHMDSSRVRIFLQKASSLDTPILIVEPLQRTLIALFMGAMGGVLVPLAIFGKNVSFKQRLRFFLLAWVLPVIPLINFHDGIVSALRQRKYKEWTELTHGTNYKIEIKRGLGFFRNFQTIELRRSPETEA